MTGQEVKPLTMWVNVYRPFVGQIGTAYETENLANQFAAYGRIACVEVPYQTGEGLNNADEQGSSEG